jgi:hypothetical protein
LDLSNPENGIKGFLEIFQGDIAAGFHLNYLKVFTNRHFFWYVGFSFTELRIDGFQIKSHKRPTVGITSRIYFCSK